MNNPIPCPHCNGSGKIASATVTTSGATQSTVDCRSCNGTGGVKVESYQEMLTVVRVLDKLFRIATDNDRQDESPWSDIMGYALLQTARHMKRKHE